MEPLHSHQREALEATGANRCGILVMPPGAGKTRIQLELVQRRGGRGLILCDRADVVLQTRQQAHRFLPEFDVHVLRPEDNYAMPAHDRPCAIVATYATVCATARRCARAVCCLRALMDTELSVLVLDEAHHAAAKTYMPVWTRLTRAATFGFTAALVRADRGVEALLHAVGPVLLSVGWKDLERDGLVAVVHPKAIRCEMPFDCANEAASAVAFAEVLNPHKLRVCDGLLRRHRDEKAVVFCDNLAVCERLARRYGCPTLTGDTPVEERAAMLAHFRRGVFRVLILSRVGDVGLDLVDLSVAVAIDSHYGSEQQTAQRVGRLMRKKDAGDAVFYDVLADTERCVARFERRTQHLRALGYVFEAVDAASVARDADPVSDADRDDLMRDIRRHREDATAASERERQRRSDREAKRLERARIAAIQHPLFKKRAREGFQRAWGGGGGRR